MLLTPICLTLLFGGMLYVNYVLFRMNFAAKEAGGKEGRSGYPVPTGHPLTDPPLPPKVPTVPIKGVKTHRRPLSKPTVAPVGPLTTKAPEPTEPQN